MAEQLGVRCIPPLLPCSFHAGKSKYPQGDNWVVTRVLEEIVGAELHDKGITRGEIIMKLGVICDGISRDLNIA